MKKLSLLIPFLIIFLVPASALKAQAHSATSELKQLLHEFLEGASVNDAHMHDRFWAEDLIYTSSSGRRFGKKEIMEGLCNTAGNQAESALTSYSAENIQIRMYGNMAVVAFRLVGRTETAKGMQTSHFLNSGTFVKRNGLWKVVNWQATKAAE
jgi:hypothetical protein